MKLRDLYLKINPAQGSTDGIGYTDQIFQKIDSSRGLITFQTQKDNYQETIERSQYEKEFMDLEEFLCTSRRVSRKGFRTIPIINDDESIDYSFYQNKENKFISSSAESFYPIDCFTDSGIFLSFLNKKPNEDHLLKFFPKENIVSKIKKKNIIKKTNFLFHYNNSEKNYVVLAYNLNHMLIHQIDSSKNNSEEIVIVPKKYLDFNWEFSKFFSCGLYPEEIESLINKQLSLKEESPVKQKIMH